MTASHEELRTEVMADVWADKEDDGDGNTGYVNCLPNRCVIMMCCVSVY
jgi:hypothetical protein